MTPKAALTLCRIPNIFTAFANVAAGAVLARGGELALGDLRLMAASGLLYCAGMVLNDFFDREVDAEERPERPIPSGQVSAAAAGVFGFSLMAGGIALAATAGPAPRAVALALAASILLYDVGLKNTALGPFTMGACRFFNVFLGLSVASGPLSLWAWTAPVLFALYTTVITFFSRQEVQGSSKGRAQLGVFMMAGLLVAFLLVLSTVAPARHFPGVLGAMPFLLFVIARGVSLFKPLLEEASPPLLGRAIGGGILLMPAIDATLLAGAGYFVAAVGVFCLALPSYALKRVYYVT